MWRSVLAVIAGIVVLTVASFAIEWAVNPLLMRAFSLPDAEALANDPWVRALMFGYGSACVALGGYVTAWIAARSPVMHSLIMGIVQAGMTVLAMLSMPGHASAAVWILTAILTVPSAALGGWVYARRKAVPFVAA